jgi:hypothetical protein
MSRQNNLSPVLMRAAAGLTLTLLAAASSQAEDLMIPLDLPQLDFVGAGVGAYPDYLGSRDYDTGTSPPA